MRAHHICCAALLCVRARVLIELSALDQRAPIDHIARALSCQLYKKKLLRNDDIQNGSIDSLCWTRLCASQRTHLTCALADALISVVRANERPARTHAQTRRRIRMHSSGGRAAAAAPEAKGNSSRHQTLGGYLLPRARARALQLN